MYVTVYGAGFDNVIRQNIENFIKTHYLDEEQENALLRTRLAYSKYVTGEQKGVAAVIRQIVRF